MQTPAHFNELRLIWAKIVLQLLGVLSSAFSIKSMTVNELLLRLLPFPPSRAGVCRPEESLETSSFSPREPSPSAVLFDLLLFFFEDIITVIIVRT